MRNILKSCAAFVFVLLLSNAAFAAIIKGPYLLYEGSNTSMTVLWQNNATESNVLSWGTDQTYSMGSATVNEYGDSHQHKYTITGLAPGTKYFYQVSGSGGRSFVTAPATTATDVKLIAYGDTRSYPASHEKVVSRMRSAYAADPELQSIVLHTGDWVGSDSENNWNSEWFVPAVHYPNMRALQAEAPIIGVRGNHEGGGVYYKKYFPYRYAGGFYRSFDYGPAHIVVLDNYTSYAPGSAQYNWLVRDLETTTKPWKIVLIHEPMWGAGTGHGNNTAAQTYLQPLFVKYKVDMVLTGHNHSYARASVSAVQHVTTGGGGAPLYPVDANMPYVVRAEASLHYSEIAIRGAILTAKVVRTDGSLVETFTITHDPAPPSPPTNLRVSEANVPAFLLSPGTETEDS